MNLQMKDDYHQNYTIEYHNSSLEYIAKLSHTHVNNNHKKLKYNQIKELKELDIEIDRLLKETAEAFESRSFESLGNLLNKKEELSSMVSDKIKKQVARTRTEESSPKNTTLYFSLLTETNDVIKALMKLLELYYVEHDNTVEPATIENNNRTL